MKTLSSLEYLFTAGIKVSKDLLCFYPSSRQPRKGESERIERTIQTVKDLPLSEIEEKLGIDVISQRPSNRTGYPKSRYYTRPRKLSEVFRMRQRNQDIVEAFLKKKIKI